jgi:uncharacterized protein YbbC (DUF1343 family)
MQPSPLVALGLEQLMLSPPAQLSGGRIGLLSNAASLDHELVHSRQRLYELFGSRLTALFAPQHGFFAERQDNMVESADRRDPLLDIPLFSLYSQTREPTRAMFDLIDTLVIDLLDVGTRVYTFIYTMSYCLEAARRMSKKVIVLDRPNPVGGLVLEGNCLKPEWRSFVGRYPIPMRHGLTIGELARLFNEAFGIGCDLEVIPMRGWQRDMTFSDTGLPWVAPSPNLPTPVSALVYPGQVIWEGTNVSEGRGTTQPFEIFGAPYLDTDRILDFLGGRDVGGAVLRALEFEPTANKWQGRICRGFQIHLTDARQYRPYRTSLRLLQAIVHCHADEFAWKPPPYEYEYERMPIDLILGDDRVRERLATRESIEALEVEWQAGLNAFSALRDKYLLYS